jgi:hypothetical protein
MGLDHCGAGLSHIVGRVVCMKAAAFLYQVSHPVAAVQPIIMGLENQCPLPRIEYTQIDLAGLAGSGALVGFSPNYRVFAVLVLLQGSG